MGYEQPRDAEFEEVEKPEPVSTALGPVIPMNVVVGQKYRMVIEQSVQNVLVEKIFMGTRGQYVITITTRKKGKLFQSYTTNIDLDDFKFRVLGTGVKEVTL